MCFWWQGSILLVQGLYSAYVDMGREVDRLVIGAVVALDGFM